jgi:hypothetical protein
MSARLIRYTLDGIKLTHDIGFGVTDAEGFDVYINRTKLDKDLDYDVVGTVEKLRKGDGQITLKAAHAASDVLLILSDTLARRVTNFAQAARFEEAEIDNEFDNLLRLLEDAALNLQSTPYFSPPDIGLVNGELPALIAGGVLRVNEHKNGFELVELDKVPEFLEALRKCTEEADRAELKANEAANSEQSARQDAASAKQSEDSAEASKNDAQQSADRAADAVLKAKGYGTNLLANHNFIVPSELVVNAMPQDVSAGVEIFSGVFAGATGIQGLTYVNKRPHFNSGDFYMSVANSGALTEIGEFTASVADFDGKPRTRGVSYALVGDEYRVTVGVDALEDELANVTPLGSVKLEQGGVETGHEIDDSIKSQVVGYKKFGETFGGYIAATDAQVESGKIYLNLILTDENYGSYLYFDAPEMPASPVDYSASYGGTVKNGVFASTDRDAANKNTKVGYRAGFNSTSTLAVYNGYQAGEGTTDKKVDSLTGGSCATGTTASYKSTSKSSCTYGIESGSRQTGNWSNFYGSYSGSVNTGVGSDGFGFKVLLHNTGIYCSGFGYGALQENTGNYNYAFGAFVLAGATGEKNTGGGARSLNACSGDNNATWGYRACFVTGGRTGSNGSYFGSEAGEEDDSTGSSGLGRGASKNNTGDFFTGLGYLSGFGNSYARSTTVGQQAQVTGVDQIQLGAPSTTTYAWGAVQDRSDERDKTDFNPISRELKQFLFDVEFQTYRFDYRDAYVDYETVQVGIDENASPVFETRIVKAERDGSRSGKRHHAGAVAQQVKDAMDRNSVDFAGYQDHSVNGGEDVKSIGYQEFIPIIGAITQDQQEEINNLESKLKLLEKRLIAAGL